MKVENTNSVELGTISEKEEVIEHSDKLLRNDDIEPSEKSSCKNIFTIFVVALVAVTYGLGLMTPVVENSSSRILSPNLSETEFKFRYGIASAMILVGGAIGHSIYEIYVSDKINNKEFLIAGSIANLLGFTVIYLYPHVYLIAAARLIMGIIAGLAGAIVPNTIYRLAPVRWRGLFISFYPAFIVLGLLLGHILSLFNTLETFYIAHFAVVGIFAIQTLMLFFINGINEEHKEVKDLGIIETIKDRKVRKSLVLALIFHIAAHLSGINFMTMFLHEVLADTKHPYLYGVFNLAFAFCFKFVCGLLCDLGGRKMFFILSCITLSISLLCMHMVSIQHIMIGIYMLSFNLGLGCVPWIILGEIFPEPYTKTCTFIAVIVNWSAAFILTVCGKIIWDFFGNHVYFIFSSLTIAASAIIAIFFKETKGQKEAKLQ